MSGGEQAAVSRGSRGIGNVVAQRQRGRIKQTNVKMTRFVVYHIYRKPPLQAPPSSSSYSLRERDSSNWADYMQLVFKCERVNEHTKPKRVIIILLHGSELLGAAPDTKVVLPTACMDMGTGEGGGSWQYLLTR